ncbi:MAG: hypothetical protein Q4G50_12135 [Corynebacterium sp.]|uniref:hypothetical protein n=1 Tax=Corynebacterium sp. TaxID=1720 RepID=UPI0026DECCC5|nr:hypothetical protein [Corynebacterium sp.]MDO5670733.1 hypothetical protein [Corynebacterium sp.]
MNIRAISSVLLVGTLAACSTSDPLMRELDASSHDPAVVSLPDVYGDEWTHFGRACPYMSTELIAQTLGITDGTLPDYSRVDHLNALVRWNDDAVEYSEFPRTRIDLCGPETLWDPDLERQMLSFDRASNGGWRLR